MCISAASLRPGCGVTSPDNQSPNSAVYIQLDIIAWRLHYLQQTWHIGDSGFTVGFEHGRWPEDKGAVYVTCRHSMWMSASDDSESYIDCIYTAGTLRIFNQQLNFSNFNQKTYLRTGPGAHFTCIMFTGFHSRGLTDLCMVLTIHSI